MKCKPYSEITVEIQTQLKTVKITRIYLQCTFRSSWLYNQLLGCEIQPCSFFFNWNFIHYFRVQDGCLLKEFFGGKRHFIYGPKSIWSKQIRGYKFSPHSRKVYNLQRKVELSFIEAGLVSKFLWPFFGFFKAFSSTYRILLKSNRIACKKKTFYATNHSETNR